MSRLHRTKAVLCIDGDDLLPDDVTRLIGCPPTWAYTKGDEIVSQKTGRRRIASFGQWRLQASAQEPGDLNAQIIEICSAVTADVKVWRSLAARYKVRLFCGLFMGRFNDGDSISPASLLALGSRGIELDLDIYGPPEQDELASD